MNDDDGREFKRRVDGGELGGLRCRAGHGVGAPGRESQKLGDEESDQPDSGRGSLAMNRHTGAAGVCS